MDRIFSKLEYQNYLAEKQFLDEIAFLTVKFNGTLNESNNIQILQEMTVESFLKYIRTIIANIQKAYNNFKTILEDGVWTKTVEKYGKYLKADTKIIITEVNENDLIPRFDKLETFINIKATPFNESMIDQYKSKEDAIKGLYSYFSSIQDVSNESLNKVINDNCFVKPNQGLIIKLEDIKEYVNFMSNFKNNADKITNDIKNINSTERTIENLIRQTNAPVNTSSNDTQAQTEAVIESIISEAMKVVVSELGFEGGNDNKNNQNSNNGDKKDINKFIPSYFGAITTVLSLKMKTLNKSRRVSQRICNEYIKQAIRDEKNNINQTETNKSNSENQSNGATNVEL